MFGDRRRFIYSGSPKFEEILWRYNKFIVGDKRSEAGNIKRNQVIKRKRWKWISAIRLGSSLKRVSKPEARKPCESRNRFRWGDRYF